jgi:uridine phosphorylase
MEFPNFKNKHDEDSMITPKDFLNYLRKQGKLKKTPIPKGVIFCYNNDLMDYILKNHKIKQVDAFRHFYLLEDLDCKIGIVGKFGIGSPIAAVLLEELIELGVKKFISIGTSGALSKELDIGDIVVCDKAIRDEGTSHHYLKKSKYAYPSKKITKKIKDELDKMNVKYKVGTSWTIDAPYRETIAEAKQYQAEGILTVEMEASALFSVAEYRGVDMGCLLTISDSLAELRWNPQFYHENTMEGIMKLYKLALKVLS